jgi:hypothetical protein
MDLLSRLTDIRILIAVVSILGLAAVTVAIMFWPRKLKIFINYRKDDTDDPVYRREHDTNREARAITEALRKNLGDRHLENGKTGPVRDGEVFLDKDDIPPGADWREYIKTQHHQSSVLVCLIGKQWLTLKVGDEVRLFRTGDIVREELEAAFQQGMEVIPVLVNGGSLSEHLPPTLIAHGFQHLNWMKLDTNSPDFEAKINELVASIRIRVKKIYQEERRAALIDALRLSIAPLIVLWTILSIAPEKTNIAVFAALGFVGAFALLPVVASWSTLKLIHDTRCREPDFSWYAAYCELVYCYLRSLGRRSVERVARVRIEAAVVHAHPEEPVPDDDLHRRQRDLEKYRQDRKHRQVDLNNAAANALGIQRDQQAIGIPPEIERDTCFDLHNATQELKRYLTVLRQQRRGTQTTAADQFLSRIRIKQGFLSPQFLTTGLMDTFEENWQPVLDWYGDAVEAACPAVVTKQLQRVQVFEFLCWLTWGPSVPHCQCEQWKSPRPQSTGGLFLQFGYGDENNSFLLCDDDDTAESLRVFFDKCLAAEPNARAFQCVTTVRHVLVSDVENALCDAQRDAAEQGGVVLRSTKIEPFRGNRTQVSRRIYQAYVWMMWVLCDRMGKPLFPDEPWRGLLPFFTHGNIAEPDTYEFIRREVAQKSFSAMRSLHVSTPEVTFRFACASDESNCGHNLVFPPALPTMRGFFMLQLIESRDGLTKDERASFILPNEPRDDHAAFRAVYSACHLPELLHAFYDNLEQQAGEVDANAPSLNAVNVR